MLVTVLWMSAATRSISATPNPRCVSHGDPSRIPIAALTGSGWLVTDNGDGTLTLTKSDGPFQSGALFTLPIAVLTDPQIEPGTQIEFVGRIEQSAVPGFETGVRYQMFHALALLALALAIARWPQRRLAAAAWLLFAGTLVFSGSLQVLAVTGARWLGAVTPVGGIVLISGWAVATWRLLAREDAVRG